MKKNVLKKILAVVLVLGIFITIFPKIEQISAATKPAKPKITLKVSEDGASAKLTIKKTSGAEGYQIVAKLPGAKKYTEITTLKLDGNKKRSFTLENVPGGEYFVKVRGYAVQNGKTVWGKYSKVKSVTIENKITDMGIEKGDIITFGSFEQDGDLENGSEPIEWIVLSKEDGKLFLTSVYVLAPGNIDDGVGLISYNDEDEDEDEDDDDEDTEYFKSWSKSGMRKWLNGEFLSNSFNEKEAAIIADTELKDAGCTDKVFLLSKDDVKNKEYGFISAAYRACAPTHHALWFELVDDYGDDFYDGVWTWDEGGYYEVNGRTACYWWLRTMGTGTSEYYVVNDDGSMGKSYGDGIDYYAGHSDYDEEFYIENGGIGIRPALVINITGDMKNYITKTGNTMQDEWSTAKWVSEDYDDDDDDEDDD
ncbi:MAG: hypothetical protein IKP88_08555 [Lachnospiraceae bacterium]|nr:hypothetical protein [Lachnospiraceae bacterium]